MTFIRPPVHSAGSTLLGYVLRALAAPDAHDYVPEIGLSSSTIRLEDRGLVLSVTAAAPPRYRAEVARLAATLGCDVLLLRLEGVEPDLFHVAADLTLGLPPGKPWSMPGCALWAGRDDRLWLVPEAFGHAVTIGPGGLTLEYAAPYDTMAQRAGGVVRAGVALAWLFRQEAR